MQVRPITYAMTKPLILGVHYAKRMPSISYAFGLFEGEALKGVCTFGQPASPWLCIGLMGREHREKVLELNRLVLVDNKRNQASFFVARCLKMLPSPRMIVSYSDLAQGHEGIVYRALNFHYTGTTKPRTDMAAGNGKHSRHHKGNRSDRVFRSAKHRYVMPIGDRRQRRELMTILKYPIMPYPQKEPSHA